MSKTLDQIYIANPITTNASTDLMYFAQSPYTSGKDAAMTYANFAAQFGAPYTAAALTEVNDTNVTLSLGGTPATALLHAVSITAGWTGQLSLARGGTNANLTASNGGIFYSTASAGAILAGTASANQILMSGASTTPAWSTATYPATTTINQLFYSSANNVIGGITSGANGVLISSNSNVPSWLANGTAGYVLTANTGAPPSWQPASGGSSPWTAGTGTNSALGGDGTAIASGNNSVSYGTTTNKVVGNSSASFGDANTINGSYCFGSGGGNTQGGNYSAIFGDGNTGNGNFQFTCNLNNQNSGSYGFVCGIGNELDSSNASFIGGARYRNNGYDYNFGWGDNVGTTNYPTASGQWNINCVGGFKLWQGNGIQVFGVDANGNIINFFGQADQSYTVATPTTGATVTVANTNRRTILNPAGTLATLTIALPTGINGQLLTISSTKIISALTVSSAGNTVVAAPSTLSVGQSFTMIYDLSATTWYPA